MAEAIDESPDVSVLIINYKTVDLVCKAISSVISRTDGVKVEIIVVDNDSSDNVCEVVGDFFQNVSCIQSGSNLGFGKANNLASLQAKGKYYFLMNPDSFLENNALKILFDALEADPEIGAAGGNLFGDNSAPGYSFCRDLPGYFTEIDDLFFGFLSKLRYRGNVYHNFGSTPIFIKGAISGAGMFIRADYFDDMKGFDPDFFMYYEDTEFFHRLHKKSCRVASFPAVRMVHSEGGSEPKKEKTIERSLRSKWIYLQKCKGRVSLPVFYFLTCLIAWQRIIVFTIFRKEAKKKYWEKKLKMARKTYKDHTLLFSSEGVKRRVK